MPSYCGATRMVAPVVLSNNRTFTKPIQWNEDMDYLKKQGIALAVLCLLSTGNAFGKSIATPMPSVVGVNTASLYLTIEDGVAIVSGSVDSAIEGELAARYVEKLYDVDRAINHAQVK